MTTTTHVRAGRGGGIDPNGWRMARGPAGIPSRRAALIHPTNRWSRRITAHPKLVQAHQTPAFYL